jgi:hypothetical protein
MKIATATLGLALVLALTAASAGANGSPYSPGLMHGWKGVRSPDRDVRYVTLGGPSSTTVAIVRTNGGRVERWRTLRGHYGIPLVAYDGTAGGLSGNGKRLVVASYGPPPGAAGQTSFAVLDTRSLQLLRHVVVDGSWSFDAIAPDGSVLYLTQHIRAGDHPLYRVRTFEVRTGLLRGALVDRLEGEADMGGEPITRASSADGRWAYTLYARRGHEPFVHALDTAEREAFCIDLPLELGYEGQWQLRLRLSERSELLAVRSGGRTLATVDTGSWKVSDVAR